MLVLKEVFMFRFILCTCCQLMLGTVLPATTTGVTVTAERYREVNNLFCCWYMHHRFEPDAAVLKEAWEPFGAPSSNFFWTLSTWSTRFAASSFACLRPITLTAVATTCSVIRPMWSHQWVPAPLHICCMWFKFAPSCMRTCVRCWLHLTTLFVRRACGTAVLYQNKISV